MAQHEMDFGFTNESKNIDSYGDIAFLKRSQTSRTPCTKILGAIFDAPKNFVNLTENCVH